MLLVLAALAVVALLFLFVAELRILHRAHSTFDNYYAFRGCTQLITKTPTYGVCKTASGQVITIVLYQGKWFLKDDLPTGFWGHLN